MKAERHRAMVNAVESSQGFNQLRALVQQFLNEGVAANQLLEDLSQIRSLVSEQAEEAVLDVMDLLVGWCAPSFKLVPRKTGESNNPDNLDN